MRKIDETEIDGIKLRSTQLRPRAAAQLASKLLKYLAPALGRLKGTDEVDMSTLGSALQSMLGELSEDDLDQVLCKSLAGTIAIRPDDTGTLVKYELFDPAQIDQAFAGKLPTMFRAVQWALSVNFSDFFSGAVPSTASVTAKAT